MNCQREQVFAHLEALTELVVVNSGLTRLNLGNPILKKRIVFYLGRQSVDQCGFPSSCWMPRPVAILVLETGHVMAGAAQRVAGEDVGSSGRRSRSTKNNLRGSDQQAARRRP